VQGGRTTLPADALAAARLRLEMPQARIALGIALRQVASAAIDISDGLTGDLAHILERSKVGAVVELAAVPRSKALAGKFGSAEHALALDCLLAGGDDYELLFAAPPSSARRIAEISTQLSLPLTRIGSMTKQAGLVVMDERGVPLAALPHAFDHFASIST
jgi:thiamine-monophosphate kinase